mmetsp:Transcript_51255/g.120192  ORF Transcript_51255/g.120192 Transcript_51255/m.120192 type:complete len:96 (-) Transcript_51255:750-1037(-)
MPTILEVVYSRDDDPKHSFGADHSSCSHLSAKASLAEGRLLGSTVRRASTKRRAEGETELGSCWTKPTRRCLRGGRPLRSACTVQPRENMSHFFP